MKAFFATILFAVLSLISFQQCAQSKQADPSASDNGKKQLFIDVHQLEPGKVTYEDVAAAHTKDLAVEGKYGVKFLKYWVDEETGLIYCLSEAANAESIRKTHAEAHGLLPKNIYPVTGGVEAALKGNKNLFLDVHYLGAGKVTAKDVAGAHEKDLAVQQKYGVNFINYWVDEKEGVVMCLSEANDSTGVVETHKEAHGLLPAHVFKVKQGQ
jgi:phenolic acid decarboxylase